jgi:DNA modification methylase|uniref:Helicase of the snf2 rad54 family n=1 Tax=Siphoviridae sp. ctQtc11 TaxID=2825497 RepID=A0A8S5P4S3_9CAUD|nr:MAG TPA: Helicase of the snf2 rad54 family [Siphoviridae sp. ctQtc11]
MNYQTYNDDCVNVCSQLPNDSIDLTITSVPFANLYTYSDDERDFSNVKDLDEFFKQMDFLIPELYRITRPGRLICLHCKQIPTFKGRDGAMGMVDFRGMLIKSFQKHKWIYHGEVTVWTDPQIEATRTKSASILWNSYKKFAENTRTGMADYVVVMQKCEREDEWVHVTHDNCDEQFHEWTRLASPCWAISGDVTPAVQRTNVLNSKLAKEEKDEKHMTPLQLDLIEHLMKWYSNENEVVLDPFAGIMSVPYVAIKNNRKAIGIELKTSYFDLGNKYLKKLELELKQPTLF